MPIVNLTEYVSSDAKLRVDRANGVIHNVKVLGLKSANGRRYLQEAIKKAIGLYEGKGSYLNHSKRPGEERDVRDQVAWLENVRVEDDGAYADWCYFKEHRDVMPLVEAAERNPKLFGLSHNVRGRERRENGENIIEAIEAVHSIDVVTDPATTSGWFESTTMSTKPLKEIRASLPADSQAAKFLALLEQDGMGDLPMEAPATGGSPEDAIKNGFKAAIHAIVDDDSLDMAGKLAKIKEILKAQEKLMGGGSGNGDGEKKADEGAAEESRKLHAKVQQLEAGLAVRDMVEEAGLRFATAEARRAFAKSLVPLAESERKVLIEERKDRQESTGQSGYRAKSAAGTGTRTTETAGAKGVTESQKAGPATYEEFTGRCFPKN